MLDMSRLEEIRKEMGLSKTSFAKKLGIHYTTYDKYLSGKTQSVSTEFLTRFAEVTNMTTDYLLGLSNSVAPYEKMKPEDMIKIPVYGHVPAGKPIEALQVDEGYIELERDSMTNNPYIGLKVKGDSMYPFYMEGDIIIIEITNDFNSGEDVVVFLGYDNEATLKRIHQKEDHIELEPLNREYPVKKIYPHDNIPVRVLGKVKELRRVI